MPISPPVNLPLLRLLLKESISELERLKPSEIIAAKSADFTTVNFSAPVTRLEDYDFDLESATKTLLDHFGAATLDGYGCSNLPLAIRAAGSIIQYIRETQKGSLNQLTGLFTYSTESFMALDLQTQNNLELIPQQPLS